MNASFAKICRVANLGTDFQQAPQFQFFFWNFHSVDLKHQYSKFSRKKVKNIFLDKTSKNHFTIEFVLVRPIFGLNLILG